jgi:hypothetical protein
MSLAIADRIRACMAVRTARARHRLLCARLIFTRPLPLRVSGGDGCRPMTGWKQHSARHGEIANELGKNMKSLTFRTTTTSNRNTADARGARPASTSRGSSAPLRSAAPDPVWRGHGRLGSGDRAGAQGGASVGCWYLRHAMRHITSAL